MTLGTIPALKLLHSFQGTLNTTHSSSHFKLTLVTNHLNNRDDTWHYSTHLSWHLTTHSSGRYSTQVDTWHHSLKLTLLTQVDTCHLSLIKVIPGRTQLTLTLLKLTLDTTQPHFELTLDTTHSSLHYSIQLTRVDTWHYSLKLTLDTTQVETSHSLGLHLTILNSLEWTLTLLNSSWHLTSQLTWVDTLHYYTELAWIIEVILDMTQLTWIDTWQLTQLTPHTQIDTWHYPSCHLTQLNSLWVDIWQVIRVDTTQFKSLQLTLDTTQVDTT